MKTTSLALRRGAEACTRRRVRSSFHMNLPEGRQILRLPHFFFAIRGGGGSWSGIIGHPAGHRVLHNNGLRAGKAVSWRHEKVELRRATVARVFQPPRRMTRRLERLRQPLVGISWEYANKRFANPNRPQADPMLLGRGHVWPEPQPPWWQTVRACSGDGFWG